MKPKVDITKAGPYTWYKIERSGYGLRPSTNTRREDIKIAIQQWLSMRAYNHGQELDCGCSKYLFKIRIIAFKCEDHGLGRFNAVD